MRKAAALVAAVALFLLAWFDFTEHRPYAAAQVPVEIPNAAQPVVQKWEYKTAIYNPGEYDAKDLAKHGKDGWELCQAIPRESHPTTFIFKRQLK